MNLDGNKEALDVDTLAVQDKWILSRLNRAIRLITGHLEGNDLGLAAQVIYDFAWNEFCDWYIELSKGDLFEGSLERRQQTRAVLFTVLSSLLRLLHPFMPYLTEIIYKALPGQKDLSCMLSDWPQAQESWDFREEEAQMEGVMDIIRAIRVVRQELKVAPGHKARVLLRAKAGWSDRLTHMEPTFQRLAGASQLIVLKEGEAVEEKTVSAIGFIGEALMPLGELVDIEKELARLQKEADAIRNEIARGQGKLANEGFVKKAPPALVEAEKAKIEQNQGLLLTLKTRMEELSR